MRFRFIAGEVLQGLRRNASMVVSVILVTFVSLTFVGAAALLQMQVSQMRDYWSDQAQVGVYMCAELSIGSPCEGVAATDEQIQAVRDVLEGPALDAYVASVDYETAQEAYDRFQERFAGTSTAEIATLDQFGATFWVNLSDPGQTAIVEESLAALGGIDSVDNQISYLEPIFTALNAGSYTAVGIAALMLTAAVLLIATTIRLSAFSRRRELGIMRLVGASNSFIQMPFILEGVVAAFIGSVLASGAIVALVQFFVQGYLVETLPSFTFVGLEDALVVLPLVLLLGIVLAALSAQFAITRYLRV